MALILQCLHADRKWLHTERKGAHRTERNTQLKARPIYLQPQGDACINPAALAMGSGSAMTPRLPCIADLHPPSAAARLRRGRCAAPPACACSLLAQRMHGHFGWTGMTSIHPKRYWKIGAQMQDLQLTISGMHISSIWLPCRLLGHELHRHFASLVNAVSSAEYNCYSQNFRIEHSPCHAQLPHVSMRQTQTYCLSVSSSC